MKASLAVTFSPDQDMRTALLEQVGDLANITYLGDVASEHRVSVLSAADAVLGWALGGELRSSEEFEVLRTAKLVQLLSAGVDGQLLSRIPAGVPIASNAGAYARPMAEHVVAMALALAKHLPQRHTELQRGVFNRQVPNRDIGDCVVGIVGFGGIGRAAATLFRAFGTRIHAINRSGERDDVVDWMGTLSDLVQLLTVSDIVVISIPLNRATWRLIGRNELEAMKSDAILVNVARGAIIDEDALFDHLQAFPTFSAGIDVWWQESQRPFTTRWPFLDLPNVIGSPHNSADTDGSLVEAMKQAASNIARALRGQPVRHLVDRADYAA